MNAFKIVAQEADGDGIRTPVSAGDAHMADLRDKAGSMWMMRLASIGSALQLAMKPATAS
jgi:hypothetical protein